MWRNKRKTRRKIKREKLYVFLQKSFYVDLYICVYGSHEKERGREFEITQTKEISAKKRFCNINYSESLRP